MSEEMEPVMLPHSSHTPPSTQCLIGGSDVLEQFHQEQVMNHFKINSFDILHESFRKQFIFNIYRNDTQELCVMAHSISGETDVKVSSMFCVR